MKNKLELWSLVYIIQQQKCSNLVSIDRLHNGWVRCLLMPVQTMLSIHNNHPFFLANGCVAALQK